MPIRRKRIRRKRRPLRRRVRRFKKRAFPSRGMVGRLRSPAPPRMYLPFRYSTVLTFTTAALRQDFVFRGNSLFDPDFTGVGNQPQFYDIWCGASNSSLYARYRVLGSAIKLEINNLQSADPQLIALVPSRNNAGFAATSIALSEIPRVRTVTLTPLFGSKSDYVLKHYQDSKHALQVQSAASDQDMQAAYNANPANQWYWHIICQNIAGNLTQKITMNVTLTYYCELSRPYGETDQS